MLNLRLSDDLNTIVLSVKALVIVLRRLKKKSLQPMHCHHLPLEEV